MKGILIDIPEKCIYNGAMPDPPTSYTTIDQLWGPEEIKEKGSRFMAYMYPVADLEQVNEILQSLRKKYHDATHVCFAYRLGPGIEQHIRYTDDGEPSGTAGMPIYNELKGKDFYNVLLAVVRYFGGTKLGTGGLARAYQGAAKKVIHISRRVIKKITRSLCIESPFEFQGDIRKLLDRLSLSVDRETYSPRGISLYLEVPANLCGPVEHKLLLLGKGNIKLKEV